MPESLRRQIGKYQIQAQLGRGGFGVVYRAYDPTVGRPVAVKVLTALGDNQLLTRFKNEAAAAGNLRHKNIVTIYDYGDDNGLPYIVMELLEGEDLNQIIAARKPMPLLQKVSIMVQVADGLWSAHRAGVVHRDVKPGNIRLLPDGTVKLMDFGIARLVAGSAGTRLTRQGHLIGTLSYMAPEQVLGDEVDALSDIFAYGSTYYELLTGNHPFQGSDPRSVFHKITAEDPEPIRNLVPDCPEALENIVNRTLQKDRDLRYQSLRDVQVDTEPILFELRQERAQSLVTEAKRLYSTTDLESAQIVLSEVFDLDPANREARRLRETIQTQLLSRLIRPKVEALLKKADEAIGARRFEEGIETIEGALRLDRENRVVVERLEEARRLLALRREISGLVAEARRQFSKQDLDGALEMLLQVVERDPSDPDAQQFLGEVRVALTRREKERDYQERMQRARELLEGKNFEEAMAVIGELDPEFKNREEYGGISAQIRSGKEKFERQQLLAREIAAVRELLAATQFESAIKKLEQLMKSFPEEVEPTKLFIVAHKQLAAYRKTQALDKLEKELSRLVESGYFERALSLIAQSLKAYPGEPRLVSAQRQIEEEWARHKRETAISQVLENSERLVGRGDIETAVEILEASCRQYPDEPRLAQALTSARDALSAKRREEGILRAIRQAQGHVDQRRYPEAFEAVDRGATEYGDDQRLSGFRQKISDAKAGWERAEAVRDIVEKSRELAARNEFGAALGLLQAGIDRFPNEPALTKSVAATQAAFAAKRREEAIERLCAEARALEGEHRFEEALKAIDRGIGEYGRERRLTEVRDQIVVAKADWERSEAIRQVLVAAQQALAQNDFDRAIGVIESALKRYPGEVSLGDALKTARNALAAKRREEAIEALCQKVQAQTNKRDFGNALKAVDRGLTEYGSDPRLLQTRDATVKAKAAWERAEEISRAVESVQQRLARGQPESAVEAADSALRRYPDEPPLLEARSSAQEAFARKRREQAIEALRERAQKELEAGGHGNALELLRHGLEQYGDDPRLLDLRERAVAAKAAWERAEAMEALIREAHAQANEHDFSRALQTVDRGVAEFGNEKRFADARARVLSAQADWERAEAIRSVLEGSNTLLAEQQPAAALERLEAALKLYGGDKQLLQARDAARNALAALRREQAMGALLTEARNLLEARDFGNAISALEHGLTEYGPDERLSRLRMEVLGAKSDWERAQSLERLLNKSRGLMRTHQPEDALALLESARPQFEGEPQIEEATEAARRAIADKRQREEAIHVACRSAQALAESHEYERAFQVLAEATDRLGPDFRINHTRDEVQASQTKWEHSQAISAVVAESQRKISANNPESALALVEQALTRFPNEAELLKALAHAKAEVDAAQREAAIAALSTQTRVFIKTQDFPAALAKLEEGLRAYGPEKRLAELRETVLFAQAERQRADASERAIGEANHLMEQRQPEKACSVLEQTLNKFPGEPSLVKALASARNALESKRRDEFVDQVCAQVRLALDRGEYEGALRHLDAGLKVSPDDRRLQDLNGTVVSAQTEAQRLSEEIQAVVESAEKLNEEGQRDEAIALLERALSEHPANSQLVAATVRIIDAVGTAGTDAIDDICRDAREYALTGKLDLAFHSLERALQLQDEGQSATEQKADTPTRSEAARVAVSGSAHARDTRPASSVKEATEEQVLPDTPKEVWAPRYAPASAIAGITEEKDPGSTVIQKERKPASRNGWMFAVAAVLLLLPLLVLLMWWLLRPRMPILLVRASPAGATVRVDGKQCSTPSCEFQLKPGQYPIQVSAEGYKDQVTNVTVSKGEAPPVISVALEPLSPILRLSSNFAEGEVSLDDRRAGRLQDGQLVIDKLSVGQHSVRVSSPEGAAAVSFNTEAAKLPVINNVSQQNTDAVAAASFGSRATFTCSNCTGAVTIDDRRVGEMKAHTITVGDIAPGTHQVKVGNDLSLVFTASATPAVNVAVNSNRNFGTMVIETTVENASVYVDGKKYPELVSKGPLFIQADAKPHVIRVAKNGYRADPPEVRLQLAKGDQLRAHFNLTPEPARLVVTRQIPEAGVFVDGARLGAVASDGSFTAELPAGNHQIEFRKDNYTAAQVQRSFEPGQRVALSGADAPLVAKAATNPPAVAPPAPKPDPNAAERAAWQSIGATPTAPQLEDFVNRYPEGIHKNEAQARLKELRAQQANAMREAAWNAVDKNSRTSLQEFLSTYPETPHAQDARSLINKLEKQGEEKHLATERAAEPAKPTSSSAASDFESSSVPVHVSNQMAQANLIRKVEPIYPAFAKSASIQGTVVFTATISQAGDIETLQVVKGNPILVKAAREAVLQWKYRPMMINGKRVKVITNITLKFSPSR